MTLDRCGIHLYPKRWKKILENRLRCLGYWCESAVSTPRCCWKFSFARHDRRGLIPCTGRMFKCCEDLRLHEGGTRDMIIMLTWKVWKLYDDLTHAKNYSTNQCDATLVVKLLWNTVPNQKTDRQMKIWRAKVPYVLSPKPLGGSVRKSRLHGLGRSKVGLLYLLMVRSMLRVRKLDVKIDRLCSFASVGGYSNGR
jgi:hypothetical protein